jgi:ABC-type uncharacterized transport system permease subunit
MSDPSVSQAAEPAALPPADPAAVPPAVESAARWFWWIAGLSLVNTVMQASGSNTSFVMGLGITAIADLMFADNRIVGFLIDAVVIGFFFFLGMQGKLGKLWAFYVGLVVYTLDALIYLYFQDWMPVGFHALAIFFIGSGVMALNAWRKEIA